MLKSEYELYPLATCYINACSRAAIRVACLFRAPFEQTFSRFTHVVREDFNSASSVAACCGYAGLGGFSAWGSQQVGNSVTCAPLRTPYFFEPMWLQDLCRRLIGVCLLASPISKSDGRYGPMRPTSYSSKQRLLVQAFGFPKFSSTGRNEGDVSLLRHVLSPPD